MNRNLHPDYTFLRYILILFFHLRLDLPSDLFPSGFLKKEFCTRLFSRMHVIYHILLRILNLMTLIMAVEEYKLWIPHYAVFSTCHFILVRSKYSTHPVFLHPQSVCSFLNII